MKKRRRRKKENIYLFVDRYTRTHLEKKNEKRKQLLVG